MEEKIISFLDSENGKPMPSFFAKMRYGYFVLTDIRIEASIKTLTFQLL